VVFVSTIKANFVILYSIGTLWNWSRRTDAILYKPQRTPDGIVPARRSTRWSVR